MNVPKYHLPSSVENALYKYKKKILVKGLEKIIITRETIFFHEDNDI